MNTALYCLKQGFRNFINNPLFSFASVATVGACIFLLCMFAVIAGNIQSAVSAAETNVGITVFFEEDLKLQDKENIGAFIQQQAGVKEVRYISAEEAWEDFRTDYFGTDDTQLLAAFEGENPLSGSDSYEILMEKIEDQPAMAEMLQGLEGIRKVNYASSAVDVLKEINSGIYTLSLLIIGILLAVSVFLISNTIHVAAVFRKRENEIMKLIGAKNVMIRAPFVLEGVLIGLLGALLPLITIGILYSRLENWLVLKISEFSGSSILKEAFMPVPFSDFCPILPVGCLLFALGLGVLVSLITINSHLRNMR